MSVFASCADLLDTPSPVCPGCRARAPRWVWVRIDGLRVLTHDGDLICPRDHSFGTATHTAPVLREVAA